MKFAVLSIIIVSLCGCATKGAIENKPMVNSSDLPPYSVGESINQRDEGDISLTLAFSGGGVRAAALSYGTLLALRDTKIMTSKGEVRLLDEVDYIASVSGGSFTSAYYGLYGDRIFEDYESEFLYRKVGDDLIHLLFSPTLWFSENGRSEKAIEYYQEELFHNATFADLQRSDGPMIVINATDLGGGVRFSFLQEYFDLICSDLHSYPVANAVTASAAVPIVFNPVVLKNHHACLRDTRFVLDRESDNAQIQNTLEGLRSYSDKEARPFIHLVDGGISDNLGLLAIYEVVESAGGDQEFFETIKARPLSDFVIIVVDASTTPKYGFELSDDEPSFADTFNAMSDVQLHRYNDATKDLIRKKMPEWSAAVANENITPNPHFIDITLNSPHYKDKKYQLNAIPTDMSLDDESVTLLIDEGRQQLLNNPTFQALVESLK